MSQQQMAEPEYGVRAFEAGDRDAFLDLHARIFEPDHGPEWFAWKYEDNPYVDHVPILLAERNGELVGARPFFALDMSVGGQRELALQPGDTMVHPDHRRQGLFTRMTERAIERYGEGDPAFFFNFPNDKSGPGYLKLGWKPVADESTYYRIQDQRALGLDGSSTWESVASVAVGPVIAGYNRLSSARAGAGTADGVTVTSHESVPAKTMAALEPGHASEGIHVLRDERFYDWRFDNPEWDYRAYVAERAGEPVAGMVVGRSVEAGLDTAKVTDVVPTPGSRDGDGLAALVHRLVRDHADADIVAAPSSLPRSTMARAGFRGDDRPPLSRVANPTTHVVRSLTGEWTHDGVELTDPSNWRLTFSEQDTS